MGLSNKTRMTIDENLRQYDELMGEVLTQLEALVEDPRNHDARVTLCVYTVTRAVIQLGGVAQLLYAESE